MSGGGDWREWSNHVLAEIKRFDKTHDLLHEKLDKLDSRLDEYNDTLVKNTCSLEEHIRRTNILEEKVDLVEEDVRAIKNSSSLGAPGLIASLSSILDSGAFKIAIKVLIVAGSLVASAKLGIKQFIMSLFE